MNHLAICFILFFNILLVNSTLPGENAESSGRGQQNAGPIPNQPNMDDQFQFAGETGYLEDENFLLSLDASEFFNLLESENDEQEQIDLPSHSSQQSFDDEHQKAGTGKGKSRTRNAEQLKQRYNHFNGILKELRKFSDKCESFPILEEMIKAQNEGLSKVEKRGKKPDIRKRTFSISRRCILVMESWMIKLEIEQKFIGMESLIINEVNISIEELILNAKQNQKILEKYPLPLIEKERQNIIIERAEYDRKRRGELNKLQNILFSTVPKEFIIQMKNYDKETNLETVKKYMTFLLNLLEPFKGHIRQLANSLVNTKGIGPK